MDRGSKGDRRLDPFVYWDSFWNSRKMNTAPHSYDALRDEIYVHHPTLWARVGYVHVRLALVILNAYCGTEFQYTDDPAKIVTGLLDKLQMVRERP